MPKAMYYHDGKGNVMEVEYDRLNGCYFTNYVGQDITFDILLFRITDNKSYSLAQNAIKTGESQFLSREELNQMLPEKLRK